MNTFQWNSEAVPEQYRRFEPSTQDLTQAVGKMCTEAYEHGIRVGLDIENNVLAQEVLRLREAMKAAAEVIESEHMLKDVEHMKRLGKYLRNGGRE